MLFPQKTHFDVNPETFDQSDSLWEEELMHLQKFQKEIAFIVAKLEDGFFLLKYSRLVFYLYEDIEKMFTIISNLTVEIITKGLMMKEKPNILFLLYQDK